MVSKYLAGITVSLLVLLAGNVLAHGTVVSSERTLDHMMGYFDDVSEIENLENDSSVYLMICPMHGFAYPD